MLEVGTHIGYITQVFEEIVGKAGQLVVIEPTPESNYYLKKNVYQTTKIICKAASNYCGEGSFFTMNTGGFTNSLDKEFLISFESYVKFKLLFISNFLCLISLVLSIPFFNSITLFIS